MKPLKVSEETTMKDGKVFTSSFELKPGTKIRLMVNKNEAASLKIMNDENEDMDIIEIVSRG